MYYLFLSISKAFVNIKYLEFKAAVIAGPFEDENNVAKTKDAEEVNCQQDL